MLTAYRCAIRYYSHFDEAWRQVISTSRGKAKAEFLRSLDGDYNYIDVLCKKDYEIKTDESFNKVAESRGVKFAKIGMRVSVNGENGHITGHNRSGNFDVLFNENSKWKGQNLNCHPTWRVTYFDEEGKIIKSFND